MRSFFLVFLVLWLPVVAACGSSDSELIGFRSFRTGNWKIYTMRPDGSQVTRITFGIGLDLDPVLSPDGTRVAFTSNREEREIYVKSIDAGEPVRITNNPDELECCLAWSADGRRLAFTSGLTAAGVSGRRIFLINQDGSGRMRLTANDSPEEGASWAPDGRRVAFSAALTSENWDIFAIGVDGTDQVRLTDSPATDVQPVWSPDGDTIAFLSNRDGAFEIYVMRADGSREMRLTENVELNGSGGLSWSPDGQLIAFVSKQDGNANIHTISVDTREVQRLTTDSAADLSPSWVLTRSEE